MGPRVQRQKENLFKEQKIKGSFLFEHGHFFVSPSSFSQWAVYLFNKRGVRGLIFILRACLFRVSTTELRSHGQGFMLLGSNFIK